MEHTPPQSPTRREETSSSTPNYSPINHFLMSPVPSPLTPVPTSGGQSPLQAVQSPYLLSLAQRSHPESSDPYSDPIISKILGDMDKLHAKLWPPSLPLNTKEMVKYLKLFPKFASVFMKTYLCARYMQSLALDKHWPLLAETIAHLIHKKTELALVKEVRIWALLVFTEKICIGGGGNHKGVRYLWMWMVLSGAPSLEELVSWTSGGILRLEEVRAEFDSQVTQEIAAFAGFNIFRNRILPPKLLTHKALLDSRIGLYLAMPQQEPLRSEMDVALDQLACTISLLALLHCCKRLRDQFGKDGIKGDLDTHLMYCVQLLFRQGLPRLPARHNFVLKILFALVLKDCAAFWEQVPILALGIPPQDLSSEGLSLLGTLQSKLLKKLSKGYLGRSADHLGVRASLYTHLAATLQDYLVHFFRLTRGPSKIPEIIMSAQEAVVVQGRLFLPGGVLSPLASEIFPFLTNLKSVEEISLAVGVLSQSGEDKTMGKILWQALSRVLQEGIVRTNGIQHTLGLLRLTEGNIKKGGPLQRLLLPPLLEVARQVTEFFKDREDKPPGDLIKVFRVVRLVLEAARIQPLAPLATHLYNDYPTLQDLAKAAESRTLPGLIGLLGLDKAQPDELSQPLLLEAALLLRVVRDEVILARIEKTLLQSKARASATNLLHLHRISKSPMVKTYEEAILLSCFGIDTLEARLRAGVSAGEDARIEDFYKKCTQIPQSSLLSAKDILLSDGRSILRVNASTLSLHSSYGKLTLPMLSKGQDQTPPALEVLQWLGVIGWLPPDMQALDSTNKAVQSAFNLLEERDTLIPVKVGVLVLPRAEEVRESLHLDEDFEKLMVKKTKQGLSSRVKGVLCDMVGGTEIGYKNSLATNHLIRATLIVGSLYDNSKDRAFELKKELGNCEVNIFFDEDDISSVINEQLYKSNFTFVEIVATWMQEEEWRVAIKMREGAKEHLQRMQIAIGEQWSGKVEKTTFDLTDFNEFWLAIDPNNPPSLLIHRTELPYLLRVLGIYYSLILKMACYTLKDPLKLRRINIEEIMSKYCLPDQKDLGIPEFLELFSPKRSFI